jgi:hypothetical protein
MPARARVAALGALVALAACSRERSPARDATGGQAAAQGAAAAGGGRKPACPGTGHWSDCAVLKRLEAAGVAPQIADQLPDLPSSLGARPALFKVGKSGLAVYLFADSMARARAARSLDTLHYVSAAKELTMRGETTTIQNDNLLALLFSRSDQQRERVSDALTAGPPQPERP